MIGVVLLQKERQKICWWAVRIMNGSTGGFAIFRKRRRGDEWNAYSRQDKRLVLSLALRVR